MADKKPTPLAENLSKIAITAKDRLKDAKVEIEKIINKKILTAVEEMDFVSKKEFDDLKKEFDKLKKDFDKLKKK